MKKKPKLYEDWIQLQCFDCFRSDKDGITEAELGRLIASGEWTQVERGEAKPIRCYQDSEDEDLDEYERADWWICWGTHIGLCDRCQKARAEAEPKQQGSLFT